MSTLPLSFEYPVAWGDLNAEGQVGSIVFLRWCESARFDFLNRLGLLASRQETGIGTILTAIRSEFSAPVSYPELIAIVLSIQGVSEQDLELRYVLWSRQAQRTVAEIFERIVCFDYQSSTKTNWPEAVLYQLKEFHFEQNWSED
ncbi:MAG: acyl-CoA thioesterase [Candidatus Sericytochromatia bacterium]